MSLQDFGNYVRQLFLLTEQVKTNSEEIQQLRRDFKAMTDFTNKVVHAVNANKSEIKRVREVSQCEFKRLDETLALKLENELIKLNGQLSNPGYVKTLESYSSPQQALPNRSEESSE